MDCSISVDVVKDCDYWCRYFWEFRQWIFWCQK